MFSVTEIIDGDTFKVSPGWRWNDKSGDTIRCLGYDTPESGQPGFEEATKRLERLILNKEVELKNAIRITYGRLLCEVHLDGVNIAKHFPEYAS